MAAAYAKVSIHAGSLGTLTAKPIIYGMTIPTSAPDRRSARSSSSFVLSPAGPGDHAQQRVRGHLPRPRQPQAKVPASIKPLTTQWPSTGG